jgi:hypothetical protein
VISSVQPIKESLATEEDKNKPRSSSQQRADSEPRASAKVVDMKQKARPKKPTELGRMPAPVQDQLVLKNHRREQSANATAGRTTKDNGWGDVRDERRTESYERPAIDEEYEIVASKA